jgi:glycine cleavage system regulatory protein
MNVQIMVTVSGADQHHVIKTLSEKTHVLGGKWLNSKISHIDQYFAGLIKIEIVDAKVDQLINDFKAQQINVESARLSAFSEQKSLHLNLDIDAKDRAGLVNDISNVLNENSIKVENMECHRLGLPDISGLIFTSKFQIAVSDDFNRELLIQSLQNISSDIIIDLHE